jgi:hypothetical protein
MNLSAFCLTEKKGLASKRPASGNSVGRTVLNSTSGNVIRPLFHSLRAEAFLSLSKSWEATDIQPEGRVLLLRRSGFCSSGAFLGFTVPNIF